MNHAATFGRDCVDDGSGCCAECGASLVECDYCNGRGYHRDCCRLVDGVADTQPAPNLVALIDAEDRRQTRRARRMGGAR